MSKSFDNAVGINEPANDIYGKLMSLSDAAASLYLNIFTPLFSWKFPFSQIDSKQKKTELAKKIVQQCYDKKTSEHISQEFERIFREKIVPSKIPCFEIPSKEERIWIVQLLQLTKLAKSGGEARRLIKGGAFFINNIKCQDVNLEVCEKQGILKVGRKFCRYILEKI